MRIIKKVPAHIVEEVWTKDNKISIPNFYKDIARYVGIVITDDTTYDCVHINISPEIQEEWIAGYKKRYPYGDIADLMMVLAIAGPKATVDDEYRKKFNINDSNFYSEPFYVEIEDGFVE